METIDFYRERMITASNAGRQVHIAILIDMLADRVGPSGYDRPRAGALANRLIGACKSDRMRAVKILWDASADAEGDPFRRAIAWALRSGRPDPGTMTAAQLVARG